MSKFGERKKLAEITISLIKEYENLVVELRDGLESIEADSTYENIKIVDCEGEHEFHLSEISDYYLDEQGTAELTKEVKERLNSEEVKLRFNEMDKNEFINYIGSLYYTNYRCAEIYKELLDIEELFL